jgi:cell wall-associated NlpC family hydrolase
MATVEEVASRVIELALDIEDEGAHYVWGSAGATPGGQEGSRMRPGAVDLVQPQSTDAANPAVFAACCRVENYYVCAGRYDPDRGGIEGGRRWNQGETDLEAYLSELRGQPEDEWEPYFDVYSPRRVVKAGKPGDIVWGEDCRDRRHFDCVGFVNYLYDAALAELTTRWAGKPWSMSIAQYKAESGLGATAAVSGGSLMEGDILTIGNHHIGLFAGDGDGSTDNPGRVVQAADTEMGVIVGDYKPQWDGMYRLSPAAL